MNEWKECKLKDVTTRITKGTTPSTLGGGFVTKGINFIKSESVSYDGKIDKSTFSYIDENTHNKLKRSQLEPNDILYSMAGIYLGKSGYVTNDILPANTNQALAIIRINSLVAIPKYIHYCLRQKSVVDYVNTISGQSAQPNINMEEIGSIDLLLPSFTEQESIVEVLSCLDEKIDLLHRNNKTLEQLADTLYRQWFIEESEDDSKEIVFSSIAKHIKSSVNPGANPTEYFIHHSLPSYDSGKHALKQVGSEILSNKYLIKPHQTLISKLNPSTPRVWYILNDQNNCVCSSEFQVYEAKHEIYRTFVYSFLKSNDTTDILTGAASGTSGSHQRVSPDLINNLILKEPNKSKLLKYDKLCSDWLNKMNTNQVQIQQLESLRDTLLPKLMSGIVRVLN